VDDVSLKASQGALAELKGKLAELRVTFTSNHAEVRKVEAQIVALESSLQASRSNIMTRIRNEYEGAQRRETLLKAAYTGQAHAMSGKAEETAHYTLLKREVDASRLLYENLLQKLKEASITSAMRANNIRVVDAAERPSAPYKPDVSQQVMLGLFGGMVLGVALIVFREQADRTLQDPGDTTYYLGLPELGVVPVGSLLMQPGSTAARPKAVAALKSGSPLPTERFGERVEMISWQQGDSLLAESYRTTLTSILFSRQSADQPRVLVFTSASPKEGKTTTVCNLGISLAEINQRVLLIDGDMRRPRLHSVFNVENKRGLSDLLLQKNPLDAAALEAACVQTSVPGLYLLPSGGSRRSASSLLHSGRLAELFRLARTSFDTVVVDTPPMVNLADARIVARFADALILVVRSGQTTRDAALLAKSRFAEDGTPILGTILNFWNPKTPGYGYYRYYYAGYQHYYGGGAKDEDGNEDANEISVSSGTEGKGRYVRPQLGDGAKKERAS
jgi:polysaccharide biosynthesis transport protein